MKIELKYREEAPEESLEEFKEDASFVYDPETGEDFLFEIVLSSGGGNAIPTVITGKRIEAQYKDADIIFLDRLSYDVMTLEVRNTQTNQLFVKRIYDHNYIISFGITRHPNGAPVDNDEDQNPFA